MNEKQQAAKAKEFGTVAFNSGINCTPAFDENLMKMIEGRSVGYKESGQASTVRLMKAWQHGWMNGNLAKA
jgi:hypothetical protein